MAVGPLVFAFLRAINTGNRRLSNEELIAPFVGAGFDDVAAYQAAGNIVFRVADATAREHEAGEPPAGERPVGEPPPAGAHPVGDRPAEAMSAGERPAVSAESLAAVLDSAYGFETAVFVRSASQLRAIVEARPFTGAELAATEGRVQVALLGAGPDDLAIAAVEELVPADDRVIVSGTELFWLPRAGIGTSQLPVNRIEQVLGPMTIRTLGTLERMLTKFAD